MTRLVLTIALILSMSPSALSDSPFGVVCPWAGTKDAGIKWIRCGAGCTALDWGAIEKEHGVFDWKAADAEVRGIIAEGASPLPILGYTPKWASSGPDGSYPPIVLHDWSDFVYHVVSRYKGKIRYWEVWNEPDIGFWKGTIEQYADLLKSAYVSAKKADPECRIVFGGTAGVNLPFTERVYQNGGKYYFDVMAVHPYQWGDTFNDEWFVGQLTDLHRQMEKYGDGHKEIWLTELGWSTGDSGITEEVQARLLAQAFITSRTLPNASVTKAFWFCIKDWGGPGYGLLRDDGSRKPAFEAYKFVASALERAEYVCPLPDPQLRCHVFRKDGKLLLAAWSPGRDIGKMALPADVKWTAVRRLGGKDAKPSGEIEVGPEPVFVLSDSVIPKPIWRRHEKPPIPYKLDVWLSVPAPEGTSRLYAVRGRQTEIPTEIHNDSSNAATLDIKGHIGHFAAGAKASLSAGDTRRIILALSLPKEFKAGLDELRIAATCEGKSLAPLSIPIRIADGPVTEFLANSAIESDYLVDNQGSGGSPSVRFNGTWTYKFDLSNAQGGTLSLCVGAHQANEWRVLLSSDQNTWVTALSGKSNRSWHEVDVTSYAGGPLFVKLEGNDQQLSELILTTKAH